MTFLLHWGQTASRLFSINQLHFSLQAIIPLLRFTPRLRLRNTRSVAYTVAEEWGKGQGGGCGEGRRAGSTWGICVEFNSATSSVASIAPASNQQWNRPIVRAPPRNSEAAAAAAGVEYERPAERNIFRALKSLKKYKIKKIDIETKIRHFNLSYWQQNNLRPKSGESSGRSGATLPPVFLEWEWLLRRHAATAELTTLWHVWTTGPAVKQPKGVSD